LKKINRIVIDWPSRTVDLNLLGKIHFIFKSFAPPENFLNRPLLFLALAFFISVLFSQYHKLSLFAFFGKFVKCVFLYFGFIEAFSNEKRIWIFLNIFLFSAFIVSLSGIFQHYSGKDFLKGHLVGTENSTSTGRISSSFFSANGLGAYLIPAIALTTNLLFAVLKRRKSWVSPVVLTLFLGLLLTCLCWTYSRSSWVGFLVVLFVTVGIDWRKIFFTLPLLLIFVLLFLPSLNNARHLQLISDKGQRIVPGLENNVHKTHSYNKVELFLLHGGSGRFSYWEKAIKVIHSSPIYGTGLNTYSRIIRRDPDSNLWAYAHNSYLQLTAETGLLGLSCFLWMLFVLLWYGFNFCKQINDSWQLTILQGILSGLIGFLVQSFFDNTFYTVQLGVLMWLIFGLTVALTRLNPASK